LRAQFALTGRAQLKEEDCRCRMQCYRRLKTLFRTFLTGYALNAADGWAEVAMHLSVKANVEPTGETFGSVG
jgi:hypothetical protein